METLATWVQIMSILIAYLLGGTVCIIAIIFGIIFPICKIQEADDWTDVVGVISYGLTASGLGILIYWAFNH